jgi:hypothetical protein
MRLFPFVTAAVLLVALTACAHTPEAAPAAPDYTPIAGDPAPPNARYYADCIGQAAENGTYRKVIDGGDELLLFTCSGRVAATFYESLGQHSALMDSGWEHAGRRYRSTAKVQRNLIGVDYCSIGIDGFYPSCVLTFNAGDFLIAGD